MHIQHKPTWDSTIICVNRYRLLSPLSHRPVTLPPRLMP